MKKHFIHSRPQNRAIYGADGAWPLSILPKEPRASARVGSIFIIALFLLAFVSSYCFAANPIEEQHHKNHHQEKKEVAELELSGKVENGIRIIEVKASRYKFEPDPIVVKLGEKVRLAVTSSDVAHGLSINEFKVKLSVPAEKTESIEFVANKKGTFHVYCSVYCGPGHSHMHASFIVK